MLLHPVCFNLELTLIRPLFLPRQQLETPTEAEKTYGHRSTPSNESIDDTSESLTSFPQPQPNEDLSPRFSSPLLFKTLTIILRASVATSAFAVGVFYPSFNNILAFIGTFFSFSVSAIFPCVAYLTLFHGRLHKFDVCLNWAIVVFSSVMVLVGIFWMPLVNWIAPE